MPEVSKSISDKIDGLRAAGNSLALLEKARERAARELVQLEAKVKKATLEVQGRTDDLAKAVIE